MTGAPISTRPPLHYYMNFDTQMARKKRPTKKSAALIQAISTRLNSYF